MSIADFLPVILVGLIALGILSRQWYTGELWRDDDD